VVFFSLFPTSSSVYSFLILPPCLLSTLIWDGHLPPFCGYLHLLSICACLGFPGPWPCVPFPVPVTLDNIRLPYIFRMAPGYFSVNWLPNMYAPVLFPSFFVILDSITKRTLDNSSPFFFLVLHMLRPPDLPPSAPLLLLHLTLLLTSLALYLTVSVLRLM